MNGACVTPRVRPAPTHPMSRRLAEIAHVARALCAWGRKAQMEDFPYG
jgi:hypothetical protein